MTKSLSLLFFLFFVIVKTTSAQNTPNTIPNLKLWLDASNVNNDGTTPADNAPVTTWKDRSGIGNDATVLGAENPGTFLANQINGKSVVRFNKISNTLGSVYQILGLDIRAMTLPKITIFTVYKQGAHTADDQAIWGCDNGGWDRFFFSSFPGFPTDANNGGVSQGTYANLITNSGQVGVTQLLTAVYDSQTNNGSAVYFNGKTIATFTDATTTSTDAQPTLRIGFDGDNNCYNGDIAEMIVYDRKLTDCEIQQVNRYLGAKYGVTFSTVAVNLSGGTSFPQGGSVTLNTSAAGTAYQWLLNGTAISGANASSYTATASGNYQVAVTNSCVDTSAIQTLTELPPNAPTGNNVTVTYTGNTSNSISATAATGNTVDWYDAATGGNKVATGLATSTSTSFNVTQKPVGTYTYYAEAREISTGNVSTTRKAVSLIINAASITITANDVTKTYGAALSNGSSTSGFTVQGLQNAETIGSVSLAYGTGAAATASAGSYTGSVTVSAATGGTFSLSNYAITYKAGKITVNPVALTVTAATQSKTYGDTDPALTYTLTAGALIGSDAFTGAPARAAGETAGTYAITQGTLAVSSNYSITFTGATFTIGAKVLTITANNQSKIYGAANPALTLSYSGFAGNETSTNLTTQATATTTALTNSAAGTYPITISGAASLNYTITYTPGTLTVSKAPLIITADNQSRPYGSANPVFTVSYSGFVNGDSQASLTTAPTATSAASPTSAPGTYPITPSGGASTNYSFTYNPGTLTVIASSNAYLTNLVPSAGTLSPVFVNTTYAYTTSVSNSTAFITLTPTLSDLTATVTVNGTPVNSGAASGNIPLQVGYNTLTVVVTAQDGITKKTYTVVVYKGIAQDQIDANNIMSPNGDGKNDTFAIKDIQLYPDNNVTIFDKGGRVIYSKHSYTNDWDGTLRGAPLTEGTYYYYVDLGPGLRKFKGFISILRNR